MVVRRSESLHKHKQEEGIHITGESEHLRPDRIGNGNTIDEQVLAPRDPNLIKYKILHKY